MLLPWFFLSLSFSSFITMCLIKGLFEFIWLGVHQTSWIITVISFFKSGEISDIIFFFQTLFFLSYIPVWNFHNAHVGPLVGALQVFKLCSLFFSLFVCCFSDLIIFTILFTNLLILFSVHPNLTLNPQWIFVYQPFYFQFQIFFCSIMLSTSYWYFSVFILHFLNLLHVVF